MKHVKKVVLFELQNRLMGKVAHKLLIIPIVIRITFMCIL